MFELSETVARMTSVRGPVRVAVIDDDAGFVRVLVKRFEGLGWQLRTLSGPPSSHELVNMRLHALVVDTSCLGPGVWDFVAELESAVPHLSVIVCTGSSTVAQRVRALRMGVDDWLTKPCHPEELLARIEAVLRRRKRVWPKGEAEPLSVGELEIRADQFQAFVGDKPLDLTRREFEVLHVLADARGRVLEREDIYQRVWGYTMAHGDRSVDVFVRKIRHKLKSASPTWEYIHTHFGIGYRMQPEPTAGGDEDLATQDSQTPLDVDGPEKEPADDLPEAVEEGTGEVRPAYPDRA
jgi:two-component system response regulator RegX3